ncbi:DUF2141 domain-containing protein [Flagellimonas sp. HMM57]|uniref:DUF2141 domain-containing protein n=1 Tax=unclassified Flagellimonas TaxID=2644544 RepID=UPI0013D87E83|nr:MULTISPECIES: DUF2141 domain-containing protein [unclassified Flagellimonas]UII77398.1 DUF2141 domain-containing protein [Flagellimonas sp. HMM57]
MRFTCFSFFLIPAFLLSQHTITVNVTNIPSEEGNINVAVYDSDATFLKFEGVFKSGSTSAKKGKVSLKIDDIPTGKYAIALFYDKNGNDELDTNWLGIPKEKVAFSNAKMKTFGPPKYEECAFRVTSDFEIRIDL